ncbi:TonB-dependent receptor [bacterium]|nr:TonB-dependent receptor [bacterium]
MKMYLLLTALLFFPGITRAQSTFTVSGHIRDAATGEELVAASFYAVEVKKGGIANDYGFYSLTIPSGTYTMRYSYVGYKTKEVKLTVKKNIKLDVELSEETIVMEGIVVKGETEESTVTSTEMGTTQMNPKEAETMPILFGEQDIVKTFQLMPGVHEASEGNSGFFVRGGDADQNLVLLDEAPVYNPSHLMGFFSVFNSDALKDVKMIKGALPAEYGGRLSSVLDIKMKEGNSKNISASGGIGLIASRLTLEGPLAGGKGSFILSGRRTYADLLWKLSSKENLRRTQLYFYDLNMKANYLLGDNDHLFVSGYFGRDVLSERDQFGFNWGNITGTVRWNHLFNDRLFLNSSLILSTFDYQISAQSSGSMIDITSAIKDINLKEDFEYYIRSGHTMKFGFNVIRHRFLPGEFSASSTSEYNNLKLEEKHAYETAAYASHEYDVNDRLKVNYGLRCSMFTVLGPGTVFTYDEYGDVFDSRKYSRGKVIKNYWGPEPRLAANYMIDQSQSVKLSYSRNMQYIHLLSNFTSSTPLDIWHPSTSIIKPGTADQVSAGWFRNLAGNKYEMSVEAYYKDMKKLVDYKTGAEIILNEHVEAELVFGKGRAYGTEYFLKKKTGKFTGWLGYTLARTERKFPAIDNGKPFPARHDRTHDVAGVGTYVLNDKWTISASWVFHTGDAVTFPSGKYIIEDNTVSLYTERNGYRMPTYQRLDLGLTYTKKKTKRYESSWNFSLYNAYGRKNAFFIYFRDNEKHPEYTEAVKVTLFTFFPSVTYNFKY